MSDEEFLNVVAILRGVSASSISGTVSTLKSMGLKHVYNKTNQYWIRRGDTIAVPANTKFLDLEQELDMYKQIRMLWTTTGFLNPWGEEAFHRAFPDDSATSDVPDKYITREDSGIQIHPAPTGDITLYANYYYMPDFKKISDMPDEFQHVILYYVMMHYEPPERTFYKSLFQDSLQDFIARAKPDPSHGADLIPESILGTIVAENGNLER